MDMGIVTLEWMVGKCGHTGPHAWCTGPCLLSVILLVTVDGVHTMHQENWGKVHTDRTHSKATITNKTRPAGSFSSS